MRFCQFGFKINISEKTFEIVWKECQLIDSTGDSSHIPFYELDIRKIRVGLFSSLDDAKMHSIHLDSALFLDYTVTTLRYTLTEREFDKRLIYETTFNSARGLYLHHIRHWFPNIAQWIQKVV